MSGIICSYQDCLTRRLPCSSLAFFGLPNDTRREIWIRNSGNKELAALTAKQMRYMCEKHFDPGDMRLQFNRKTLLRHAVPMPHHTVGPEPAEDIEKLMQRMTDKKEAEMEANMNSKLNVIEYVDDNFYTDFVLPFAVEVGEPLAASHKHNEEIAENFAEHADSLNSDESDESTLRCTTLVEPEQAPTPICNVVQNPMEDYNSDRHFALSLVNYFQRLGAEKKAVAKVKILTYLTALEFGQGAIL